jgi:hypothetical protein
VCFDRLPAPSGDPGWLQQRYDEWRASGLSWDGYCRAWAEEEGLHAGQDIVLELDARFDRQLLAYGPYFFADLPTRAGFGPSGPDRCQDPILRDGS